MSSRDDRRTTCRHQSPALLRPGQRDLWYEARADGQSRFVVRHLGDIEQQGTPRATRETGAARACGAVRLHVLTVADAIEAAYAGRCRVTGAGAAP